MMAKFILTLIPLILLPLGSHAGRESNGGLGIQSNDKIYLLDLFEHGVLNGSSNSSQRKILPANSIATAIPLFDPSLIKISAKLRIPLDVLNQKIWELFQFNWNFAESLLQNWQTMEWDFVSEQLPETHDDYTDLDRKYPKDMILQVAYRIGSRVQIQESFYNLMDAENRIALLFHEGISKLYFDSLKLCPHPEPTSKDVRRIVALLFSPASHAHDLELSILEGKFEFKECDLHP